MDSYRPDCREFSECEVSCNTAACRRVGHPPTQRGPRVNIRAVVPQGVLLDVQTELHPEAFDSGIVGNFVVEREEPAGRSCLASNFVSAALRLANGEELHGRGAFYPRTISG